MTEVIEKTTLEEFLKRFTYKPGWRFRVRTRGSSSSLFGRSQLHIVMETQDSRRDDSAKVEIEMWTSIPYDFEEGAPEWSIREWVRHEIRTMELHELDEWFKVDGKLPYDPHARPQLPVGA